MLLFQPKQIVVEFPPHIPPVIARVNAPSQKANEEMRRVELPTNKTYIIPPNSKGHFVMVFDWIVVIKFLDGKKTTLKITIPELFTTDFASIPRFLHSLISPLNNTIYASILHDYLYRNPTLAEVRSIDRETADRIFYWGMRHKGVWRATAIIMYLGVRLGGKSSYIRS